MDPKIEQDIEHIHRMMEQSSRFMSLSGWSGVAAGLVGIITGGLAFYLVQSRDMVTIVNDEMVYSTHLISELLLLGALALVCAIGGGIFFTIRKSKQQALPIWSSTTKQLLLNLFIPLIAGGLFCLALVNQGAIGLVAPATLIFYGTALISASKYTYGDIRYLGICEITLGVICAFFIGWGLFLWTLGFGFLHLFYGILMQRKYH